MFESVGIIKYHTNPYKLIVEVDPEISRYYRSLIPKSHRVQSQMYKPHISVVRKEIPNNVDKLWFKYENKKVEFQYSNYIFNGEIYYWLNVYSDFLIEIRKELNLNIINNFKMYENEKYRFHITLGNIKHLNLTNNKTDIGLNEV